MPFIVIAGKSADALALQAESCREPQHVAFAVVRFRAMGFGTIIITDGRQVYTPEEIAQHPRGNGNGEIDVPKFCQPIAKVSEY